jgi:hypothetical protein
MHGRYAAEETYILKVPVCNSAGLAAAHLVLQAALDLWCCRRHTAVLNIAVHAYGCLRAQVMFHCRFCSRTQIRLQSVTHSSSTAQFTGV